MMVSFVLSFFPRDVLDEILNLIESVSEDFPSYFSSHQLVFGHNPNLPGIMTDKLPALEGTTQSEAFAKHLNVLHDARKAYIQTEADERLRRALRTKVRAAEQIFENGDTVFYKREGKDRWLGPANVVFQDGKVVFIRHCGIFVRVSPNRLTKTYDSQIKTEVEGLDGNSSDQHNEADKIKMSSNTVTSVSETVPTPPDNPEAIRDQDERIERGRINPRHVKAYDIIKYKVNDEWETAQS